VCVCVHAQYKKHCRHLISHSTYLSRSSCPSMHPPKNSKQEIS